MDELYFWLSAVLVGLIFLKAVPSEKVTGLNLKIHEKIPGRTLSLLYVFGGVLIFAGTFLLLTFVGAPRVVTYLVSGAILGAFIGLIPLVDNRKKEKKEGERKEDGAPRGDEGKKKG